MSRETSEWLNTRTLIGCTDKRGTNAWHYRAEFQMPVMVGDEIVVGNHYSSFIPVSHVRDRLFNFNAIKADLFAEVNGMRIQVPGQSALIADDNGDVLGVNSVSYQPHQYSEWLLDNVAAILDDELGISSAGLLANRSQAWVEVSVPDTIVGSGGFAFRPNLIACTSFDGSIPTTYKRTITATVCDNTLAMARGEAGQEFRVKHTAHSLDRIMDARAALDIVHSETEEFQAELDSLLNWKVQSKHWELLLREVLPTDGTDQSKSSITRNERKREELTQLYTRDERSAPWKGTALGVLQAFNTHDHHFRGVRKGASRAERNMTNALNGSQAKNDTFYLNTLAGIVPQPA